MEFKKTIFFITVFIFFTIFNCKGIKVCECIESKDLVSNFRNGDITLLINNFPKRDKKIYSEIFTQHKFSTTFFGDQISMGKYFTNGDTCYVDLCLEKECLEIKYAEKNGQCLIKNNHELLAFLFWKDYRKRFSIAHILIKHNMSKEAIRWLNIPSVKTEKAKIYIEESRSKIDIYGMRTLGKEQLISIYKKLALEGEIYAMYKLGHWYDKKNLEYSPNYKLPSDYKEDTSFGWYLKAAQLGEVSSIFRLAEIYEERTEEDKKEAYKWYHKLNELDENTFSHLQLYKVNKLGIGCEIDIPTSKYHLERAVFFAKESKNGAFEMANVYENGLYGLEENKVEALKWYTISKELGNEHAQYYIRHLSKE